MTFSSEVSRSRRPATSTCVTSGSAIAGLPQVGGGQVGAQPLEGGLAQPATAAAAETRDVDDDLRLHPRRAHRVLARHLRGEGGGPHLQWTQRGQQVRARTSGEARADPADELPALVPRQADEDGAEPATVDFGAPAADDDGGGVTVGQLEPVGGAAARCVGGGAALGDDALEALLD